MIGKEKAVTLITGGSNASPFTAVLLWIFHRKIGTVPWKATVLTFSKGLVV